MARKFDVSRELDINMTVPVSAESFLKLDDVKQAEAAVAKTVENILNKSDEFDTSVEMEFTGFTDDTGEAKTKTEVKESPEDFFADFTVSVEGTQKGTYEEGIPSNNYYEPDDPPELNAYDDADTITEIFENIEKVFSEFGFEIDSSNIETEDNSRSWDSVIEELYEEPEPEYEPNYDD